MPNVRMGNLNNGLNNNSKTMFMLLSSWQSHCGSLPGSFVGCRIVLSDHRPKIMSYDLGCEFADTGCPKRPTLSLFVISAFELDSNKKTHTIAICYYPARKLIFILLSYGG